MASTVTDEGLILKAIQAGVRAEIQAIVDEETKKAQESIEARIKGEVDRIALKMMQHYSCERRGVDLVIHVKKDI